MFIEVTRIGFGPILINTNLIAEVGLPQSKDAGKVYFSLVNGRSLYIEEDYAAFKFLLMMKGQE